MEALETEIKELENLLKALLEQEEVIRMQLQDSIDRKEVYSNPFDEEVTVYHIRDQKGSWVLMEVLVAKAQVMSTLAQLRYIAKPSVIIHNHKV